MIDSNDVIKGSGPISPTRAGDLPYMKVLDLAFNGRYTKKQLTEKLNQNGGITDLLGTADMRDVRKMAEAGDRHAALLNRAVAYQVSKYAGAMAAALKGDIDAIILTGGIAYSEMFTGLITEYIGWIAEVVVMPGEFELEAMAAGALRVMRGEETPKTYTGVPVWAGFKDDASGRF
jgi:butyrate kinase